MIAAVSLVSLACALSRTAQGSVETLDFGAGRLVQGAIVKENSESVFVDLGYTVLAVPRRELVARRASDTPGAAPAHAAPGAQATELWTRGAHTEQSVTPSAWRERIQSAAACMGCIFCGMMMLGGAIIWVSLCERPG